MKQAKRPDVFNQSVIIQHFVDQGLAPRMANPLASDLKLIIPILIKELGRERINEILKKNTTEYYLAENAFLPSLTAYIVRWAEDELSAYKRRKAG